MNKLFKHRFLLFFLMASSLAYAQTSDIDAFKLNQTQKFFTKYHLKAKGVNISIEYPKDWEAKEGERPNIVQKFSRAFEDGSSVMCLILIKDLPSQVKIFSDEDIAKEMFSEEVIKSMLPGNSKLLEHRQTKYDGQQGALSSFVMVQERSGIQIFSYVFQHAFIYSKKMIFVQCTVGGLSSNSKKIEKLYKSYAPLFIQIGNSIVIHDKWNKNTVSEESSAMGIAFGEYWWITLIISALLTWGVGLLPPILIRFVFVRKPLSKKVALILVSMFWFLNLAFFIAIGSQSKTHAALFLVALASYYILRKKHKDIENKNS
ncbi:hypothetical protein KAW08_06560 [bacterium]|nr:hypothetical protein [bacterium]